MGQTLDINSVRSNNLILKYLRSTLSVWKGLENLSLRQRQKQNSKTFLGVKSSHSSFVSRVVWVETPGQYKCHSKTSKVFYAKMKILRKQIIK